MNATSETTPRDHDETPPARSATRVWVYTQSVKGTYQRLHRWTGILLQAILVVVPWIQVGGHPLLQADISNRRLYAFGEVFTPRETIFLVLTLLFSAFSLFFFTALFGRLWCGYACPQTVFLEEWVRPIEKWIEGERGTRMLRDRKGLTVDRVWRKVAKWTAFAAVAVIVSMSFVSWFSGAIPLWTGRAGWESYTVMGVLAGVMFFDFAWFREQFCNFLCPYARFQGALCDDQSLVVAYNEKIGEPRGKPAPKGAKAEAPLPFTARTVAPAAAPLAPVDLLPAPAAAPPAAPPAAEAAKVGPTEATGACIDCKKCVTVCPQGIDIRDGFQLECITCGRCIDACQGVMEKRGQESLISYTQLEKGPIIRPRTVVYAALLTAIVAIFLGMLTQRHGIDANVVRAPGTLFTVDTDGFVRNTYLLRVTNKEVSEETYVVTVDGLPEGFQVQATPLVLDGEQTATVPLIVRVPPGAVPSGTTMPMTVSVASHDDQVSLSASFAGGS